MGQWEGGSVGNGGFFYGSALDRNQVLHTFSPPSRPLSSRPRFHQISTHPTSHARPNQPPTTQKKKNKTTTLQPPPTPPINPIQPPRRNRLRPAPLPPHGQPHRVPAPPIGTHIPEALYIVQNPPLEVVLDVQVRQGRGQGHERLRRQGADGRVWRDVVRAEEVGEG